MKKIYLILLISIVSLNTYSQQIPDNQINNFVDYLKGLHVSKEEINNIVSKLVENPELYNGLWKTFVDQANKKDKKWNFLNDLNILFKTFKATDDTPAALGMTYDLNFNYAHFYERNGYRNSHALSLTAKGNVAFSKHLNPADFLETKVNYRWSQFFGGVVKSKDDTAVFTRLNDLNDKLTLIKDMRSQEAVDLLEEFNNHLVLSDQFYYSVAPKFAFESNQDFSDKQFTPGLAIDLSAKAWRKNSTLAWCNIFDYPFAVLRRITGTDGSFTLYGSTIPTVQLVFDYVLPTADTTRENLAGNLDPFPRIKFETSFRTFITRVKKENIFFNADFRYYQEIGAPAAVVNAKLDMSLYFVMALQTSSGFYVSYANGKLPFDAKNDEVYSIGFNYKFN